LLFETKTILADQEQNLGRPSVKMKANAGGPAQRFFDDPEDLTLTALICVAAAGFLPYVHVANWANGNQVSLDGFEAQQGRLYITLAAYIGSHVGRAYPYIGLPKTLFDYVAVALSAYSLVKICNLFRVFNFSFLGFNLSYSPSNLISPGSGVLALGAATFLLCRAIHLERT
jgi:hypothetical protein